MIADISTGLIIMNLFDTETILSDRQTPGYALLANLIPVLISMLIAWIYAQFTHRAGKKLIWEKIFRVLRPAALLVCLLTLFLRIMIKSRELDFVELYRYNFAEFIVLAVLLIIGSSYAYQDILYLRQARLNSTLLQNQEIQNALLQDTRMFRHNIANMLYGFRGALTDGDRSASEAYYADLVARCAVINNENVANLQRIPSEAVKTLLLAKITEANDLNIPFYLYVDRDLIFHSLRESDMCQVLGVLLDNAIESTQNTAAPLVTLEMHNADSDMEIAVRNTYDEDKGLPGQDDITFLTASTKDGHPGLGLKAVESILKGRAVTNLYIRGRFVEASILVH